MTSGSKTVNLTFVILIFAILKIRNIDRSTHSQSTFWLPLRVVKVPKSIKQNRRPSCES